MILKTFVTGLLEDNNYLLIDEKSKEAVLIDCTEKNKSIEDAIEQYGATLKYILLTHGHFDHVLGVNDFRKKYDCKVLVHEADQNLLENVNQFTRDFGMPQVEVQKVDGYINENKIITFGDIEVKTIHTPGHTLGSVCFLIEDKLFSGDTIFYETVGRTDLKGGSFIDLKNNIKNKIFTLDDNIEIYPGHGRSTTVGYEKVNNKFL